MRAADAAPGAWVVYRSHPEAQGEDGEVVRVVGDGPTVMVRYKNGPQAGETVATHAEDLTPGWEVDAVSREDTMRDAIALAFEGCGEAWTDDASGDRLAQVAAEAAERVLPAEPEPAERGTPEDAVGWLRSAAGALDTALRGYEPDDWRDAVRLLYALRKVTARLAALDAGLVRWLYLNGEHGHHQTLDGVGAFSITRGRAKERWQVEPAVRDYVESRLEETGEEPDWEQVVAWVLEVMPTGTSVSVKKTPLRDAGLDVADYYASEPGSLQVGLPRPDVT